MKTELIEWKERFIDVLTPRFLELFDELIIELDSIDSEASSKTPSVNENEDKKEDCYRCNGTRYIERPSIVMPCPDCNTE